MPARQRSKSMRPNGPGFPAPRKPVAQQHAEWVGLLRPDGPFIAIPVLADVFNTGLDEVPAGTLDKLRLACPGASGRCAGCSAATCAAAPRSSPRSH